MTQKTYLKVPAGSEWYAKQHGARREEHTGTWFVTGPVPPELQNFADAFTNQYRYRQSRPTPLSSTLADLEKQWKAKPEEPHALDKLSPATRKQIEKLVRLATEKIGGNNDAIWHWFNTPKLVKLKGKTPFEVMYCKSGYKAVEELLRELRK